MHFPFISKSFPPNGANLLPFGPTILPNAPSFSQSYDEQTLDLTNLTIDPFISTLENNNSMKASPLHHQHCHQTFPRSTILNRSGSNGKTTILLLHSTTKLSFTFL